MDALLSKLAMQTVQLVGKAAFGAASSIALKRVTAYVNQMQPSNNKPLTNNVSELERLQSRFEIKLRVVTPAIDLIELISARGYSTMAGVLQLTQKLRKDVMEFTARLAAKHKDTEVDIVQGLGALIAKIDDAVPLLNLALTTSGVHLGGTLPEGVSPGRLMQASSLLSRADAELQNSKQGSAVTLGDGGVYVGEPFVLRLYSLFVGSVRPKMRQDFTWKEEFVLCRAAVWRSHRLETPANEPTTVGYSYELRVVEDLDDGRYHDEPENTPEWAAGLGQLFGDEGFRPGRALQLQLGNMTSLHYSFAGSLLNIEDSDSPVLVIGLTRPNDGDTQGALSKDERNRSWYAMEVSSKEESCASGSDSESDAESDAKSDSKEVDTLAEALDASCSVSRGASSDALASQMADVRKSLAVWNRCTLSLLEYLIRLACVEMNEQMLHLDVHDERLRLYLMNSSTSDNSNNGSEESASAGMKTARSASSGVLA
ncbi:DRAP deaminase [Coemansia sp. RSA 1722]|nr:DRAP deaminase [Coemansia sp. RSA 486]KAJ2236365.1 DRAP deaminase [Coemansia sp. RSA 485]KAJ2596568.1 DRAP deaminase [Coemansia sp. RSA 1721]KAJ2604766.1 DRAP deaminase [Coemansia sp. RSA 1722]